MDQTKTSHNQEMVSFLIFAVNQIAGLTPVVIPVIQLGLA